MEVATVKERLSMLGYTASDSDDTGIAFAIEKVTKHIYNFCNISEIPDNLEEFAIDAVCGEYLSVLRALGNLPDTFDVAQGMSSIKVGDTSLNLTGKSGADLIDALVNSLIGGLESELICFRKLYW